MHQGYCVHSPLPTHRPLLSTLTLFTISSGSFSQILTCFQTTKWLIWKWEEDINPNEVKGGGNQKYWNNKPCTVVKCAWWSDWTCLFNVVFFPLLNGSLHPEMSVFTHFYVVPKPVCHGFPSFVEHKMWIFKEYMKYINIMKVNVNRSFKGGH